MKAEPSRLFPRKPTENLELLIVPLEVVFLIRASYTSRCIKPVPVAQDIVDYLIC